MQSVQKSQSVVNYRKKTMSHVTVDNVGSTHQISEIIQVLDIADTLNRELAVKSQINASFNNKTKKWNIVFRVKEKLLDFEFDAKSYDPLDLESMVAEVKLSND